MDQFDAFISYSHAADGQLAPQVQRGLQRLAKGTFQRRALRVFHDNTGLSTNPHLWGSIESALTGSEWFVLLASPEAARSEWVAREVTTWLASKPLDHILIVVTDGDIGFLPDAGVDRTVTTCLPEALIDALDNEPRWLDMRWARTDEQLDLRNGRFRAAVADLAAPIHGVAKDDLEGEDVRQQKRAKRLATIGVTAVAVLAVVSLVAAVVAIDQQREATAQRDVAQAQRARADEQSNKATSRALAAQAAAVSPSDIDLGLLLGVEGYRRDPSIDTTTGLLAALNNAKGITQLVRHLPAGIVDIEVSPDRAILYAVTSDGDVWKVDTNGWTTVGDPLLSGVPGPFGIDVSKDGSRLAVNSESGVTVVETGTGEVVATGIGESTAGSLGLSDDGTLLSVGLLAEPLVQVFDLDTMTKVYELEAQDAVAIFLPDQRLAVSPLGSSWLGVYDLDGDPSVPVLSRDDLQPGGGLTLSPDGTVLIQGGLAGTGILLDAVTLDSLSPVLSVRGSRTGDFFFSPDGTLVGMGSDDGSVRVFDVASSTEVLEMTGMTGAVWSEFVGDSTLFSASYYDDAAVVWDAGRASQLGVAQRAGDSLSGVEVINGGRQMVVSIVGEVVVAPVDDIDSPTAKVATGTFNRALDVAEQAGLVGVYSLEIDDTTGEVIDRKVRILQLPDLSEQVAISFGENAIENISLSPDGTLVAVGLRNGSLAVYDTVTGEPVLQPLPVDEFPCCMGLLVWNADGTRLHTGGQDGTLRTFDTATWTILSEHVLAADASALRSGRLTPDGTQVIVPTEAGTVFLVDAATGEPQGEPFVAAGTQLQNAALVNEGSVLAAISRDGKLRLWDVASRRAIGPAIAGHVEYAPALDSISDTVLISGGAGDGRLITWTLDPASWVARACELAGRNLSRAEWDRYVSGNYQPTCTQWPEEA